MSISGEAAGLHLVVSFKDICFDEDKYKNALIFGYGNVRMELIEEGVKCLRRIFYENEFL